MSEFTTPEGCDPSAAAQPSAASVSDRRRTLALSRLATVFGLWFAVAVLYWPSAVDLNALWTSMHEETYTHGYLILLLSLWLTFRERGRLAEIPVRPVPRALIALALLSAAWVWAWRAEIQEIHLMLLPLILFAAIVAALGWRIARRLAFAVGYLYFAMPFWSDGNAILQHLSARMIGALTWTTGVPAFMQGDLIRMPAGTIEIAGGCSGLHAFIVGIALATLYGEIAGESLRRRFQWIGVMGVLSLIVNWVRIFTVVVAAYLTHMHSSLVKHHYWLGWWLFAAAFAGFLWWSGRKPATGRTRNAPAERSLREAPTSAPGFSVTWTTLTFAILAILPALAYGMDWTHSGARTAVGIGWPAAPPGWSGPQPVAGGNWHPYFLNPGGESLARYTNRDGRSVEVFAVAYRVQTQRAKLLSYWNHLLGANGQLRRQSIRLVNSPSGPWRETLAVNPAGERSLIWSRYRVGNRIFVRPRLSQAWYGLEALALRPPLSSLVALRARCTPDCRSAGNLLRRASALRPAIR